MRVQPIIKAIEEFMARNQMTVKDLALQLGMAYSTLTSALRGDRPFPAAADVRRRVAKALGVPGLQVAIWCELLNLDDFIVTHQFDNDARIAIEAMRHDPTVSYFVPGDDVWNATPEHAKIALILMYQTLTGKRFLETAKIHGPERSKKAEPVAA